MMGVTNENQDFMWVEEVNGALSERAKGEVVRIDDGPPRPCHHERYRSVYVSDGRLADYIAEHKGKDSSSGIKGFGSPCTTLDIPFDIDRKTPRGSPDWDGAFADARQLLEALDVLREVDLNMVRCSLTGGKGVHLYLPAAFFGGFEPSEQVPSVVRAVAKELADEAGVSIDLGIYDRNRLLRVPNSHHESGRYCVPVYAEELLHIDTPELIRFMDGPRPEISWVGEVEPVPSLVALKRECESQVRTASQAPKVYPDPPEGREAEVVAFLREQGVDYAVQGDDYIISCPTGTHADHEPSFGIQRCSGIYHCFGCNAKGNWDRCRELLARSQQSNPSTDTGSPTLADIKSACRRWLYIEDDTYIDVVLATVVAHNYPGDPVWLFLVGAPGSAKTEIIRTLRTSKTYSLSSLTQNTLISGLKTNGGDPSLLPKLDGKVLVIKDFTTVLSSRQDVRTEICGQLRDIYDGFYEKSFGSGVGTRRYDCHLGMVVGVTPAIDRYSSIDQSLGERFLKFRLGYESPDNAVRRAGQNANDQMQMRTELGGKVRRFVERRWETSPNAVARSDEMAEKIVSLSSAVALLRTAVPKNRRGELEYLPEPEVGTRLCQQLTKLGAALAMVRGKNTLGEEEYDVLVRVGRDSIPSLRWRIVSGLMADQDYRTAAEIGNVTDIATDTMSVYLNDLRLIGAADRKGDNKYEWRPSERLTELLRKSGIADLLEKSVLV